MGFLGGPIYPLTKKDPRWSDWHQNVFEENSPIQRDKRSGLDSWQWEAYGNNPNYRDTLYRPHDYQGDPYVPAPWIYQEQINIDARSGVQASILDKVYQFLATFNYG